MEIKIGYGIANEIKFGITPIQVETILGKPDKISNTLFDNATAWLYNARKITIYFDNDLNRLFMLDISADEIILYGKNIKNITQKEFIKFLNQQGIKDIRQEDYVFFKVIESSTLRLSGYFEFDRLNQVEISLQYDDGNELWPEEESLI